MKPEREQWSSKIGFILATAGSAVGLGNIWKFPYLVGENGGAAFIILYLICVVLVGLPIVIAEILIGRTAQKNPVGSFRELSKSNPFWIGIGLLGVITGFIILSYYNVIAGWSIGYVVESIKGTFENIDNPKAGGDLFISLSSSSFWSVGFHFLFMVFTVYIVYFGVTKGIEKAGKILMPTLLILIILLVIRGVTLEGAQKGINYLIQADFSVITTKTVLLALGQAFFSLSLGMGALLTYGSYMSKKENIPSSAISIVGLDTFVAILAGFMIFPALFALGMQPDQGPALIYNILPIMFNYIPGGYIFRIFFFLLLSMAALTSTISLMEVITSFVVDELKTKREITVIILGLIVFSIGVPSALSSGVLKDFTIFGLTYFDLFDFIAANIFLPLGGIFIALFTGWFWSIKKALPSLLEGADDFNPTLIKTWIFLIKFVAPVMVLIILLSSLGVL